MSRLRLFCPPSLIPPDGSLDRLSEWARQPGVEAVVALPDLHWKKRNAAPTGAVLASREFLFPGFLDHGLGCGMLVIALDDAARPLDSWPRLQSRVNAAWHTPPLTGGSEGDSRREPASDDASVHSLLPQRYRERAHDDFGAVGGGNHFVEIWEAVEVLDAPSQIQTGARFLVVHAGSGRLGRTIGRMYAEPRRSLRHARELAYHLARHPMLLAQMGRRFARLPADSAAGRHFLAAARAVQAWGAANRAEIARRALAAMGLDETAVHWGCDFPHNYVEHEEIDGRRMFVHRHGATQKRGPRLFFREGLSDTAHPAGKTGADPIFAPLAGGPGEANYLVCPRENTDALASLPHGAGKNGEGTFKPIAQVADALYDEGLASLAARCQARVVVKFP